MRAKTIDFERSGDIKRLSNIGMDRKMPADLLEKEVFNNIWPKVKIDPFYLSDADEETIKNELEGLIYVMIENQQVERPSDMDESIFRDYWTDVYKA